MSDPIEDPHRLIFEERQKAQDALDSSAYRSVKLLARAVIGICDIVEYIFRRLDELERKVSHSLEIKKRDTTNWVMELTPDEGEAVLKFLVSHRGENGGYNSTCELCRALSRISLGRDYGVYSLLPETQEGIIKALERK